MLRDHEAVLARGRAMAAERRTSRAVVRRKTGYAAQNEGSGLEAPVWATVHADVPIRIAGVPRGAATHRTVNVSGVEVEVALRTAHLPHNLGDLADGDLIEITAGENTGLVVRILETTWQDQATEQRHPVFTVERPKEWP